MASSAPIQTSSIIIAYDLANDMPDLGIERTYQGSEAINIDREQLPLMLIPGIQQSQVNCPLDGQRRHISIILQATDDTTRCVKAVYQAEKVNNLYCNYKIILTPEEETGSSNASDLRKRRVTFITNKEKENETLEEATKIQTPVIKSTAYYPADPEGSMRSYTLIISSIAIAAFGAVYLLATYLNSSHSKA